MTAPLRPQSAEQLLDELANQLQPTHLDIIHKMYRVAVRGHSPDDVLTVLKKLVNIAEAYARAARDEALSVCQLEPTHSAPEVLDYATGVQGSYTIRRIFEWGPSKLPTAEFWNPSGWSASGYVINDRKLADAICNLLATLPVGESPAAAPRCPDKGGQWT